MPVTHGVTGSSPVRTANEEGFLLKSFFFSHYIKCQKFYPEFENYGSHDEKITILKLGIIYSFNALLRSCSANYCKATRHSHANAQEHLDQDRRCGSSAWGY